MPALKLLDRQRVFPAKSASDAVNAHDLQLFAIAHKGGQKNRIRHDARRRVPRPDCDTPQFIFSRAKFRHNSRVVSDTCRVGPTKLRPIGKDCAINHFHYHVTDSDISSSDRCTDRCSAHIVKEASFLTTSEPEHASTSRTAAIRPGED